MCLFTFHHLKPKTEVVSIFIFTSTPCILHPPRCCRKMLNRLEWLSSKNSQLDPVQSLNSWWSHGIGTADPTQTMRKTWMRMVYVTCINSKKKKSLLIKIFITTVFLHLVSSAFGCHFTLHSHTLCWLWPWWEKYLLFWTIYAAKEEEEEGELESTVILFSMTDLMLRS